jgi:hypothetical protein
MPGRTRTTRESVLGTPEKTEETAPVVTEETVPEEKTEETVPEETAKEEPATVDANADPFAVLEEATEVEYTRGPARIDVAAETPARIKADLHKSFDAYKPNLDADGEDTGKAGTSKWLTQKFPTAEMASMYHKLAKRYAAHMDWTFRASWMQDNGQGTLVRSDKNVQTKVLRFCAKPKETKSPLNTSTTAVKTDEKTDVKTDEKTDAAE